MNAIWPYLQFAVTVRPTLGTPMRLCIALRKFCRAARITCSPVTRVGLAGAGPAPRMHPIDNFSLVTGADNMSAHQSAIVTVAFFAPCTNILNYLLTYLYAVVVCLSVLLSHFIAPLIRRDIMFT